MAILVWVKSKKVFLKIQGGTGDALTPDDIKNGMKDYVSWSTFRPECLDVDDTLDMEPLDGGIQMSRTTTSAIEALPECYESAFDRSYEESDVIELLQEE